MLNRQRRRAEGSPPYSGYRTARTGAMPNRAAPAAALGSLPEGAGVRNA